MMAACMQMYDASLMEYNKHDAYFHCLTIMDARQCYL